MRNGNENMAKLKFQDAINYWQIETIEYMSIKIKILRENDEIFK